jgi:hypothetical protein
LLTPFQDKLSQPFKGRTFQYRIIMPKCHGVASVC